MIPGWDAPDDLQQRLKEKGLVQRERTPVDVMLYAVYLYLTGPSLQRVAEIIEPLCPRTRKAVHNWVQRLGAYIRRHVPLADGPVPDVLVLDETRVQIGTDHWTLWVAQDPATRAVYRLHLTRHSTLDGCRGLLDGIHDDYGAYPDRIVTDRAGWYKTIADEYGLDHIVVAGGVRSYVERWNETLKDRSRSFDKYHPCHGGTCSKDHVRNWVFLVTFYYNRARRHQSRGLEPPVGGGSGSCWSWLVGGLVES